MAVPVTTGVDYEKFVKVLESLGYKAADFQVMQSSQGDVTRTIAVRAKRVSLTITWVSRQITREYRSGPGSSWLTNAEWELKQGLFGPP